MSCNTRGIAAAICGFIEVATGEKISQTDWHGLRDLAEDKGYDVGRSHMRAYPAAFENLTSLASAIVVGGESSMPAIGASEYNEASDRWDDSIREAREILGYVDGPAYTKNTDAIMQLLITEGVGNSLQAVRKMKEANKRFSDNDIQQRMGTTKPEGKNLKSYGFDAVGVDITETGSVWAKTAEEAKHIVNEWIRRFKGGERFTTSVQRPEKEVLPVESIKTEVSQVSRIKLAGMDFTVSSREFSSYPNGKLVILTGKRGGEYFLRPFLGEHTGKFEVISGKSGAPLRDKSGKSIQVVAMGDSVERTE